MATRAQVETALRRAHAAGDTEGAKRLARALKVMIAAPPKTMEELTPGLSTNPTDGMSGPQRIMAGMGKSVADTGRGLAQLFGAGPTPAEVDAQRALDAPLTDTVGGMTGNIAGQIAQVAVPVGGGARLASAVGRAAPYVGAAVRGAAFAGAQPVASDETRSTNAAIGGALGAAGQGVASGLGVLATHAGKVLSPVVRESIDAARAAGIPLNVSQVTNSAPIKAAQAVTRYLPFSGAGKAAQAQQEAFNRAVGRSFGADARVLSDDVMRGARQKLSAEFDDIYARNDVAVTPDVMRNMLAIEREAAENMIPEEAQIVRNQIERIVREAGDGMMTGKKYQALRTALQGAERKGGDLGRLIKGVRTELDDAAAQSVGPDDAARLARVRSGWANLRMTEEALKQVSGAAGNVRPSSLWPLIRKGSTKEMRMLAQIGQNVLKDGLGDPGTAQRVMYGSALTGSVGGTGGAIGGVAGAATALTGLAKLAGAGIVAGRALNSNAAASLLQQGRPLNALARIAKPAPKMLPLATPAAVNALNALDIGMVYGLDPSDPRYKGGR